MKMVRWLLLLCVASAGSIQSQTPKPRPAPPRQAANVIVDPVVLAVGNDLLSQDLIRSCASEIRDEASDRRANGESEAEIFATLAGLASKAANATRTETSDSYAMNRDARAALQSPTDNAFALGTCFYGRRLQQLSGAKLNLKPWVGQHKFGAPSLHYDLSPTRRGCVTIGMSPPVLSDGGNTYRLDITLRNACATDQLVVAERWGPVEKLETGDWRLAGRGVFELREPPTQAEWPEWKGPMPSGLGFVRVARSRAKARPIMAGHTVRIPYVYDARAVDIEGGTLEASVSYCPAFSSDGYYHYLFRGAFYPPDASTPIACKPNLGAGRFVRR